MNSGRLTLLRVSQAALQPLLTCQHPALPCHPSAHRLTSLAQFPTQPFKYHGTNVEIAKHSEIEKDLGASSIPRSCVCVILQVGITCTELLDSSFMVKVSQKIPVFILCKPVHSF